MVANRKGPREGPQPLVRHCPTCKGEVFSVDSRNQPAETSHRYQCVVCDRVYEINLMDRVRNEDPHAPGR